jgi:integrase
MTHRTTTELITFATQSAAFLESLETRRRGVKPGTLATWNSIIKKHVLPNIGSVQLASFENGALKKFADNLDGLSPKSVRDVVAVVKAVVSSAIDENGNELFPRRWNHRFLDLVPVTGSSTYMPDSATIEKIVRESEALYASLFATLAGTGLRIGEALSARIGDDGQHTCFDAPAGMIRVRTAMWRSCENDTPKTRAAVREVDMPAELCNMLSEFASTRSGFLFSIEGTRPLPQAKPYTALKAFGVRGFHGFRRYRTTILRAARCPEDLVRAWIGHSAGSVTDRYSKLGLDLQVRKEWIERVGLGFELRQSREG